MELTPSDRFDPLSGVEVDTCGGQLIMNTLNSPENGFTHPLRLRITTGDGQVGISSPEDGFTHSLRVEIAMRNGQVGKNSSKDD
jgi:hypothetical protein